MSLTTGTRLGPYEVLGLIGAGGMGEVYKARDTRLDRTVAIKVLPDDLSADLDRRARFEREAKTIAGLSHPHICTLHDVGEAAGSMFIVMEHLDGESLAQRIEKGPLSIEQALTIAIEIAEALSTAHRRGIIHRDLKPGNVMLTKSGAKLLDFGLAKLTGHGEEAAAGQVASMPTRSAALTAEGVIVGTLQYMAPEQVEGKPADARTDLWALGAIIYEMITGRRAFEATSAASLLAAILERQPPPMALLSPLTPLALDRLVSACLAKSPDDRPDTAHDVAKNLHWLSEASGSGDGAKGRHRRLRVAGVTAGVLFAAAIGAGLASLFLRPPAASGLRRTTFDVLPPPGDITRLQLSVSPADEIGGVDGRPNRRSFALSPDGRTVVFSAVQKNQRSLYVRPLDQPTAVVIPGTVGAVSPFFSPDGQWVGYWSERQIWKVALGGGPPVVVLPIPGIFGASWGDNDRIVFARGAGGLLEVPSSGGTAAELTTPNRGEVSHRLPHVLPGGGAVLFTITKNRFPRWDETEVWVYSRGSRVSKRLIEGGADARYVSSGHLVYAREGVLLVVPFDLARLEVTGGPVGVLSDVMQAAYMGGERFETGVVQAEVSGTGTLVYITGGVSAPTENDVIQADRTGRASALSIAPHDYRVVRLSPDGTRLALSTLGRDCGIWLYTFTRGTLSKLAMAGRGYAPVWTPDSERIVYAGGTNGPDNLHWIRADGGGSPELLLTSPRHLVPGAWTPDGRHLLYYAIPSEDTAAFGPVILSQDVVSKSPSTTVAGSSGFMGGADVSPDGRWIAYHLQESGQLQVHVDAYPGPGPRYQVSTDGGGSPIWRADGRELYYARANEGTPDAQVRTFTSTGVDYRREIGIIAVAVTTQTTTLTFGTPRQLFAGRYLMNTPARGWDVSGDGQRFLLRQARQRPPDVITQMSVVQNWHEELKRLVPTK